MAVDSRRGPGPFYNALLNAPPELPFNFPSTLAPGETIQVLPDITEADLIELRNGGWARLGILAAIVDDHGRILMIEHETSDKTEPGAWGPLGETSAATYQDGAWVVEHPAETLRRGIKEELGIHDTSLLDPRAAPVAAWQLYHWPVGVKYPGQYAFAVCPTVVVPHKIADFINEANSEGQIKTPETRGAMFIEAEEVAHLGPLRDGTLDWLYTMKLGGILDRTRQDSEPITLPVSRHNEDSWRDVIFDQMSL